MRSILFSVFANTYGVVKEDMLQPFSEFASFNEFFTRQVKTRVIDVDEDTLLSPADSKVLRISEVTDDSNLLVKGVNYKLGEFLTGNKDILYDEEMLKAIKLKHQTATATSKIY